MRKLLAAAAAVLVAGSMAACSSNDQADPVVATSTVKASTSTSETPKSTTAAPSESATSEASASEAEPAADTQGSDSGCLVGSIGQPQFQGTQCMDKQIASCAMEPYMYERGTTWFTDGTSGWTQHCADQMPLASEPPIPAFDQDAYNQQFRDDYWATHPKPTFDPNSADGYGPNQELPPLCLRFPDNYDC